MSHSSLVGKAIRWQICDRGFKGVGLVLWVCKASFLSSTGALFQLLEASSKTRKIYLAEGEYEEC